MNLFRSKQQVGGLDKNVSNKLNLSKKNISNSQVVLKNSNSLNSNIKISNSQNSNSKNLNIKTLNSQNSNIKILNSQISNSQNSNINVNISIDKSLLNSFNTDEEFQNFLVLYSGLSNSMTYFWYIVYRSLYYFIDKTGETKIIDDFLKISR
jgi:hypothetical protein